LRKKKSIVFLEFSIKIKMNEKLKIIQIDKFLMKKNFPESRDNSVST